MYCFVIFLVCLSGALAQKPCCQPDKFQIYILQKVGTVANGGAAQVIDQSGSVFYDFPKNRQAWTGYTTVNGQLQHSRVIYDYSKKILFYINTQKQTCQRLPFPTPPMKCLPANSRLIGTFAQGSQKVNGYSISIKMPYQTNATAFMTAENCVLTSQAVTVQAGTTSQMIGTAAFNYSPNVPDSAFTVPSFCPNSTAAPAVVRPKRSISQRRLLLPVSNHLPYLNIF